MQRQRDWRGSVIAVQGRLYLQVKDEAGKWRQRAPFADRVLADTPENRTLATRRLEELSRALHAAERATGGRGGPVTVESWATTWFKEYRDNRDKANDESRLKLHVYPEIGSLLLKEVRPSHLARLAKKWKAAGLAPRTRWNIYSVVKALFRDAAISDLIERRDDPCILTERELGKVRDSATFHRHEHVYTRGELEQLISDERVPQDRRVWNALLGLAMLRTGEAAGLQFKKLFAMDPLDRIVVDTTYDHGETKTEEPRYVPVHPVLKAILAEWRVGGWARMFGRPPTPDDLVCPVAPEPPRKGKHKPVGSMRDKNYARKRLMRDLAKLEFRHRRAHDLRRTGISLARDDGAEKEILRWATHAAPREVMDLYTTLHWTTVCREIAKLRVARSASASMLMPRPSE